MGWQAIIDLVLKLIPTLISIVKSIIDAIQSKPGFDVAGPSADQVVCEGIDKLCAALQAAKPAVVIAPAPAA